MSDATAFVVALAIVAALHVVLAKFGWTPQRMIWAIEDGLRWSVTPRKTREQRITELERELGIDP